MKNEVLQDVKQEQTQAPSQDFDACLTSREVYAIRMGRYIVNQFNEVIREDKKKRKKYTESELFDLRCLLNRISDEHLRTIRSVDLRLYREVVKANEEHRDLVAKHTTNEVEEF